MSYLHFRKKWKVSAQELRFELELTVVSELLNQLMLPLYRTIDNGYC